MSPNPATPDPEAHGLMAGEPVLVFLAGLVGVVGAGLAAATSLDWVALTGEQTGYIIAFVTATTASIGAVIRATVWSPASVADLVDSR